MPSSSCSGTATLSRRELEDHGEDQTEVIEEGGQDRGGANRQVGNLQIVGHDQRRRAHHGRDDLAARRRGGLDPAGELRGKPAPLDHGDGDRARPDDVGDGGARHRSEHGRGCDRGMRGTAAGVPRGAEGDADQRLAGAGIVQEGAKDDEGQDGRDHDPDDRAENALVDVVPDVRGKIVDEVGRHGLEDPGPVLAGEVVDQRDGGREHQRQSPDLPHGHQEDDAHACGDQSVVKVEQEQSVPFDLVEDEHIVQERVEADDDDHDVDRHGQQRLCTEPFDPR